jgi:hypothetical protein
MKTIPKRTQRVIKRVAIGLALALLPAFAIAQKVQQMLTLSINGKALADKALVIGGKTYIPVSSLKQFGFTSDQTSKALSLTIPTTSAAGGSNQLAALEGCVNETLFNGVYRFRIVKIEADSSNPDRLTRTLTIELRNGTQDTLSPSQAGFDGSGNGILLEDDKGTQLDLKGGGYQSDNGGIFKALPRAGGFITRWTFEYPYKTESDRIGTLTKLLIPIKVSTWQRHAPKDTKIADPSFRVNLTCTK